MKESRIETLRKKYINVPLPILIKSDLLFQGVTYTGELAEAGEWSIPNYQPYRFQKDEDNPTGKEAVDIPYLMNLTDGSLVRLLGNGNSPYRIEQNGTGYVVMEGDQKVTDVDFQKRPLWQRNKTSDGTPMSASGVSQHGDMLILNPAPGCEYFLHRDERTGENYRCKFCHYGVPDQRSKKLGQEIGTGRINAAQIQRIMEVCEEAIPEIEHFYLVGGSMASPEEEAKRYIQLAEAVQKVNRSDIPVCCGSSSLNREALIHLRDKGVTGVCFNLEVWDEELWKRVCPGKEHFVGRQQWMKGLLDAVEIFGQGNVMSAFVAGIELTIDNGFQKIEDALESCLRGTEWLLQRGILPLYSIQWPFTSQSNKKYSPDAVLDYFIRLNVGQSSLRQQYNLKFPNDFVCHSCTYMQLECDFDFYL